MEQIQELENKIKNLSDIYENQDWLFKIQYDIFNKLFENFAKKWIYFLMRKKNHSWDKKQFLFAWADNYFETWFWEFNKKVVPYNQNFTIPINIVFFKNWTFSIWTTLQSLKKEVQFFEDKILKKIHDKLPDFKETWRNFETLAKKEEWRIAYWTDKMSDFSKIEEYITIISDVLSKIDWVEKVSKDEFIKMANKRLDYISEKRLEIVKDKEEIIENINNFHNILLNGTDEDKEYLNWLIRRGTNFIMYQKNWKEYFAPSRYIWYKDASIARHNKVMWNWWDTTIAISKILWELEENEEFGKIYQEYCNDKTINYWKFWNLDSNIISSSILKMPKSDKTSKLLNSKKQIILYWPPWTGKTYNIENIIENHSWENYSDLKNDWRVEFITFHQSFSYEEFIEWIKPDLNWNNDEISYKIEDGIFKKIVNNAKQKEVRNFSEAYKKLLEKIEDTDEWMLILNTKRWKDFWVSINSNENLNLHTWKDKKKQWTLTKENIKAELESDSKVFDYWESYFEWVKEYLENDCWYTTIEKLTTSKNYYLIIDEINRWNISKIFWELITLLESDKRLWEENEVITKLPYSKEDFWIPSNLFIVATMNTSDKSIVSLDTALRRRFWFKEMLPDYSLDWLNKNIEWINLSKLLQKINNRIEYLIDKDHLIWHSYFLKTNNISDLKPVIYNEILPLLEEYFYWEEEKIRLVLWSKLFEKKNFDDKLFENKGDFENDDNQYEINENLSNEDFINALKNIIKYNEEN